MRISIQKHINCNVNSIKSVVLGVTQYPEFISLCKNVVINTDNISGTEYSIKVGYGPVSSDVICKVYIKDNDIIFDGKSKILNQMSGKWSIIGDEFSTNASFELDISFKNPILDKLFYAQRHTLSDYIVNLFISRTMQQQSLVMQ